MEMKVEGIVFVFFEVCLVERLDEVRPIGDG